MENRIKVLIEKYFNGTANREERLEVEKWAKSSPENQELFYDLLENWERQNPKMQVDIEGDFQKLMDHIEKSDQGSDRSHLPDKPRLLPTFLKIAAAVTVILISYLVFKSQLPFGRNTDLPLTHINPKGVKSKHILPDSSVVWLNAASKLSYRKDFGSGIRAVRLEGEAFFEVRKDTLRPFVVTASEVSVKVLGTSFNIRAYQEESVVETVVLTGRVAANAEKGNTPLILKPNDIASYSRQNQKMLKSQVDAQSFVLWKEGILRINDRTLREIANELERWYGVTVIISGNREAGCRITGTFDNKSLDETLRYMQALIAMDYKVNGKEVTITVDTCEP